MWQCKWLNLVDNLRTLEVMSPDDQILIRFATNQKMHIWMKYKLDSKKYRKFWTNRSGTIWWPNLELIQVAPSGDQISNQLSSATKINLELY